MNKVKIIFVSFISFCCCLFFTACPAEEPVPKISIINSINSYEVKFDEFEYSYNPYVTIIKTKEELEMYLPIEKYDLYIKHYDDEYFLSNYLVLITLIENMVVEEYTSNKINDDYVMYDNNLVLRRDTLVTDDIYYMSIFVSIENSNNDIKNINLTLINNKLNSKQEFDSFKDELISLIENTNYDNYNIQRTNFFNLEDLQQIHDEGNLNKFVVMLLSNENDYVGNIYIKSDKMKYVYDMEIEDLFDKGSNPAWYYFSGSNEYLVKLQKALNQGLIDKNDIVLKFNEKTTDASYYFLTSVMTRKYLIEDLRGNIIKSGRVVTTQINTYNDSTSYYYFNENTFLLYNDMNIEQKNYISALELYHYAKFKSFSVSQYRTNGVVKILYSTRYNGIDLKERFVYRKYYDGIINMELYLFNYSDILNLIKESK